MAPLEQREIHLQVFNNFKKLAEAFQVASNVCKDLQYLVPELLNDASVSRDEPSASNIDNSSIPVLQPTIPPPSRQVSPVRPKAAAKPRRSSSVAPKTGLSVGDDSTVSNISAAANTVTPAPATAANATAAGAAKQKRKRNPRDPDAPKPPTPAFFEYSSDQRTLLKEQGINNKDTLHIISEGWKTLADAERKKYQEAYEERAKAYRERKAEYETAKAANEGAAEAHQEPSPDDSNDEDADSAAAAIGGAAKKLQEAAELVKKPAAKRVAKPKPQAKAPTTAVDSDAELPSRLSTIPAPVQTPHLAPPHPLPPAAAVVSSGGVDAVSQPSEAVPEETDATEAQPAAKKQKTPKADKKNKEVDKADKSEKRKKRKEKQKDKGKDKTKESREADAADAAESSED